MYDVLYFCGEVQCSVEVVLVSTCEVWAGYGGDLFVYLGVCERGPSRQAVRPGVGRHDVDFSDISTTEKWERYFSIMVKGNGGRSQVMGMLESFTRTWGFSGEESFRTLISCRSRFVLPRQRQRRHGGGKACEAADDVGDVEEGAASHQRGDAHDGGCLSSTRRAL